MNKLWMVVGPTKQRGVKPNLKKYIHTHKEANAIIKYNKALIEEALTQANTNTVETYLSKLKRIHQLDKQIKSISYRIFRSGVDKYNKEAKAKLKQLKQLRLFMYILISDILSIRYKK